MQGKDQTRENLKIPITVRLAIFDQLSYWQSLPEITKNRYHGFLLLKI